MSAKEVNQYLVSHVCPICGKTFLTMSVDYVFKARPHRKNSREKCYCSYTCWRKVTKPKEDREMRRIQRELSGLYYSPNGERIVKSKKGAVS